MKNYIVIVKIAEGMEIDLLIPDTRQDTFTIYPIDRMGYSKHYPDFREILNDLKRKSNRYTLIPTSASTVDEVLKSHPELFI